MYLVQATIEPTQAGVLSRSTRQFLKNEVHPSIVILRAETKGNLKNPSTSIILNNMWNLITFSIRYVYTVLFFNNL